MTFDNPRRFLTTCDASVVTPEPWLTIGSTKSVGASNNPLKSAVHEGDQTIAVGAFSNSNTAGCSNPMFYSITSSIPGFVVALDVINFKIVVANRGQTLLKQTETLTLSISGTDITPFTKTFVYILYDCTQTTETTKLINWVIDSTQILSQTVTLAITAGNFYDEYCTTYLFSLKKGGSSVSLTDLMAFTNYNPITNAATGPSITIGTNEISKSGSYVLKKELMETGNQAITFNVKLCGLTVPSNRFTSFEQTQQTALKLISTQTDDCSSVPRYTMSDSFCQSMSHTMKNGATLMIENGAFASNGGLQWKRSGSNYSLCWQTNPPFGTQTFTLTSSYPISDDFGSQTLSLPDHIFTVEVQNCNDQTKVNLSAPTTWIEVEQLPGDPIPASLDVSTSAKNLIVYPFNTVQICSNNIVESCCSNTITYTIRTLLSDGSVNPLTFATISNYTGGTSMYTPLYPIPAKKITLNYANRSYRTGEEFIQSITLEVTATLPSGIQLIKTQGLKLVKCRPASTVTLPDVVYNLNRDSTINYPPVDPSGIGKGCGLNFQVDSNDIRSYRARRSSDNSEIEIFSSNVPDDGNQFINGAQFIVNPNNVWISEYEIFQQNMENTTISPEKLALKSFTITLKASKPDYPAFFSFVLHFCKVKWYDYTATNAFVDYYLVNSSLGQNFEFSLSSSAQMDFHLFNIWTTQSGTRTVCQWNTPITPFIYSIIEKNPGELPLYSSVCSYTVQSDRVRLNMDFTPPGLVAQKFWVTYKLTYDDGLFSNYDSGTNLTPIEIKSNVQIALVTCTSLNMVDGTQWMQDQVRQALGLNLTYRISDAGNTYKQETNILKASFLVPNYNEVQCGTVNIKKVRVKIQNLSGADLDCDPGCTASCQIYDPPDPFVGCFIKYNSSTNLITMDFSNRKPELIQFNAIIQVYFKPDDGTYVPTTMKWLVTDCHKDLINFAYVNPILTLTHQADQLSSPTTQFIRSTDSIKQFKSAIHEGQTISIQQPTQALPGLCGNFVFSFSPSNLITGEALSGLYSPDLVYLSSVQVMRAAQIPAVFKEKITITMRIRGQTYIYNWDSTFVFDYVFYDCTTTDEPKYPISYLILDTALGGPIPRTVTLPITTGQQYVEYCKPYFFSWKPTAELDIARFQNVTPRTNMLANAFTLKTSTPTYPLVLNDMVIPPSPFQAMSKKTWITVQVPNPISDTVGPSITMQTSQNGDSGRFTLKKELMVENKDVCVSTVCPAYDNVSLLLGNQPVDIQINTCYLANQTTYFPTICNVAYCPTTTQLQIVNKANNDCITLDKHTLTLQTGAQCTLSFKMDLAGTLLSTTLTKGLTWNDTNQQLCWELKADKTDLTGLANGVHSLVYTQTITQTDLYTTASPASAGVVKDFAANLSLTVRSCSNAASIGLNSPPTGWIKATLNSANGPTFQIILPNQSSDYNVENFTPSGNCGYGSTGGMFCCSPFTFTARGVRSDLSEAVGFATLSGSTLITTDFTKRNYLLGEEFVQVMQIEVIMSNAEGATSTNLATITIYNCAGAVTQPNIHYLIGSGTVTFQFNAVSGINYTQCNVALFTSSTVNAGPFAADTNATITMDMSTQVLSVASTSAVKAGLWYYKKDLMWAGVGSEYFQIQYCNIALPSPQFATTGQRIKYAKQEPGPIEVIFNPVTITGGAGCFAPVYSMTNTNNMPNHTFDDVNIKMTVPLQPTQINVGAYSFTVNSKYTTSWKEFTMSYTAFTVTIIDCFVSVTAAITAPPQPLANSDTSNPVIGTSPHVTCIKEANNCSLKIGTFTSIVTECGAIRYEIVQTPMITGLLILTGQDIAIDYTKMTATDQTIQLQIFALSIYQTQSSGGYDLVTRNIQLVTCDFPMTQANISYPANLLASNLYTLTYPSTFPNKCLPKKLTVNGLANIYSWIIETQTQSTAPFPTPTMTVGPIADTALVGNYNISIFMQPTSTVQTSIQNFILSICQYTAPTVVPIAAVRGNTSNFEFNLATISNSVNCAPVTYSLTGAFDSAWMSFATGGTSNTLTLTPTLTVLTANTHTLNYKISFTGLSVAADLANLSFIITAVDCAQDDIVAPTAPWTTVGPNFAPNFRYEEGTGSKTLQIKVPVQNFPTQCGSIVYSIYNSNAIADPNITVIPTTGLITIATPAGVALPLQTTKIRISNSFGYIENTDTKIEVIDCNNSVITPATAPSASILNMVTTGPDWSYQWPVFTKTEVLCPVDKYSVTCTKVAGNTGIGLCPGFQINMDFATSGTKAVGVGVLTPRTILAQYNGATLITVDHEGEFNFEIKGWSNSTPENVATMATFKVIAKTPCNNSLNWIQKADQQFLGSCRTVPDGNGGTKGICDDIHYTVFTIQENPIIQFTHRLPYSCFLTYSLRTSPLSIPPLTTGVPTFLKLQNNAGLIELNFPTILKVETNSNLDKDYDQLELALYATVGVISAQYNFKLFIYNDCSFSKIAFTNTGQSLIISSTVSKTDTISYVQPVHLTQNVKYCLIYSTDFILKQTTKPPTLPIANNYDPVLFTFNPVTLGALGTPNISIHAKANEQVKRYNAANPSVLECDLVNVTTDQCNIDFEIQVKALHGTNGTNSVFATGSVTFTSECFVLEEFHNSQKLAGVNYWSWTTADRANFDKIYQINDAMEVFYLAKFVPQVPSMSNLWTGPPFSYNITDLCGPITYRITNIQDPFIFTDAISQGQPPKISVQSNDPDYASTAAPYRKSYFFNLIAKFTRFSELYHYATMNPNPSDKTNLPYVIKDDCLGLTYNQPTIMTFNHKNSSNYNTTNLVVTQPVLKPLTAFYVQYAYYKKFDTGEDFGCGSIRYTIDCNPPATQMTPTIPGDLSDPKGMKFNVYSESNNYVGSNWLSITASISPHYPKIVIKILVIIEQCIVERIWPNQADIGNKIYNLMSSEEVILFEPFLQDPQCNQTLNYTLTAYENTQQDKTKPATGTLPIGLIRFQQDKKKIVIESSILDYVDKIFNYYITSFYNPPIGFDKIYFDWGPFAIQVKPVLKQINSAPLRFNLQSKYYVYENQTTTLNLGVPDSPNSNNFTTELTEKSGQSWIKFKEDENHFVILDMDTPQGSAGNCFFVKFSVKETSIGADQIQSAEFQTEICVIRENNLPNEIDVSKLQRGNRPKEIIERPTVQFGQFNRVGQFVLNFTEAVECVDEVNNKTRIMDWNSTNEGKTFFKFWLSAGDEPYYQDNIDGYEFSWFVINATETSITFQFDFNKATVVSQVGQDKLNIGFLRPE